MGRALRTINSQFDREELKRWVDKSPWGTRVEFKAAKRTLPQNDRMWAMLTDIAQQKEHAGRRYTPDQWKILFMHAAGREVQFLPSLDGSTFIPWGQSSSDLSIGEMTELIEFMFSWGAEARRHVPRAGTEGRVMGQVIRLSDIYCRKQRERTTAQIRDELITMAWLCYFVAEMETW